MALDDLTREYPPGTRIDRYEIVATLGSGGCGVVYSARHVHLDQIVALKLLHRGLIHSEERVERFFREARAAAAVGNQHIVRVSDCGLTDEGVPFLAMEFLKGIVLEDLLSEGRPLEQDRAVRIAIQILEGLSAAHEAGVVHRDLKPENVFLVRLPEQDGEFVKIVDFGVSKVFKGSAMTEKVLTSTGVLLGTPRYMAPEQFQGAKGVDHRVDLFAAAVVLYQMLTGVLPFDGRSPLELAHRATTEPPRPFEAVAPQVSPALRDIVFRGLEKDPDARWGSAVELANALRRFAGLSVRGEIELMATASDGYEEDDDPTVQSAPQISAQTPRVAGQLASTLRSGDASVSPTTPALVADDEIESTLKTGADLAGFDGAEDPSERVTDPSGPPDVSDEDPTRSSPPRATGASSPPRAGAVPGGPAASAAPSAPHAAAPSSSAPPADRFVGASSPSLEAWLDGAPARTEGARRSMTIRLVIALLGVLSLFGGIVVGTVLVGDGLWRGSPPRQAPTEADPLSAVELRDVQVGAGLDRAAVMSALERSRSHLGMCARPNQETRIPLEVHVAPPGFAAGRLSLVRASAGSEAPAEVVRCCADALRAGVPPGWNPGASGVFTVVVVIPGR